MDRNLSLVLTGVLAGIFSWPAQADFFTSRVEAGRIYAFAGEGLDRLSSSGMIYGRNPAGTGPAYHFQNDVTGISTSFGLGYVFQNARAASWFGGNTRLLFTVSDRAGHWNGAGTSPVGTKIPFIDNRTPNLQLTTVNQDNFSLQQNHRQYELLLITDYTLTSWGMTVMPFMGLNHYRRREVSELWSLDPSTNLHDVTLSETLSTDYSGYQLGASLLKRFHSDWSFTVGASASWLRAHAKLAADQHFPTYPAPPGLSVQLNDESSHSTLNRTIWAGLQYDFGHLKIDLTAEKTSWNYAPKAVNPILFTDPAAHLANGKATDRSYRLLLTLPFLP